MGAVHFLPAGRQAQLILYINVAMRSFVSIKNTLDL